MYLLHTASIYIFKHVTNHFHSYLLNMSFCSLNNAEILFTHAFMQLTSPGCAQTQVSDTSRSDTSKLTSIIHILAALSAAYTYLVSVSVYVCRRVRHKVYTLSVMHLTQQAFTRLKSL